MKRPIYTVALVLSFTFCTFAETLDKIVAVVDGKIITHSDVRQEAALRAILGEKEISEEAVLQQVVEGVLIESQLVDFPGIEVQDQEVSDRIARVQKNDGISAEALRNAVMRRLRTARYFDVRFRQFLRASDQDIRAYYDTVFVPEATARGVTNIPPLEQVSDAIRENVLEEQLDHEVNIWLEAVRRRSNIEILK
jgi:parvulin-like peptidyl-prolyl isomerase